MNSIGLVLALVLGFNLVLPIVSQAINACNNVVVFNGSQTCVCPVGQYYANGTCNSFQPTTKSGSLTDEVVDFYFRPSYDVKNFQKKSKTETFFFVAAIALILVWLIFACSLRCLPLGNGNVPGGGWVFQLRSQVTRLDRRYHRRHWMDEQKVLIKRRSELGGTCSTASYIFTVGSLLGITIQQLITRQSLTQNLVVNNGREVALFANNLLWNLTTISGMDCSQYSIINAYMNDDNAIRPLDLSDVGATITCEQSPGGPSIIVDCPNCQALADFYTVVFEFSDAPGKPALASGFEFQFKTTETNNSLRRESGTTGAVKANGTLRGADYMNVLSFRGIPRIIKDSKNLKLIQATFEEFLPGPVIQDEATLLSSVENANSSLRLAMRMQVLSDYIVLTDRNPLTMSDIFIWLAAMGGMYQLSISLFLLMQLQVEIRVRSMAYDEDVMDIAKRVFHRQKLWRKAKYAMKSLYLLSHWKEIKSKYDAEKTILLLEMEEQQKVKETSIDREEEKKGFYSGFLRRRLSNSQRSTLSSSGSEKSIAREVSVETEINVADNNEAAESPIPVAQKGPYGRSVSSAAASSVEKYSPSALVHGAAQSLGAAASIVRPRVPHVKFLSGQFSGPNLFKAESSGTVITHERNVPRPPEPPVILMRKKPTAYFKYGSNTQYRGSIVRDLRKPSWLLHQEHLPAAPCISNNIGEDDAIEWDDLANYAKELYDYNVRLREDFLAFQTMIENTVQFFRPHSDL